MMLCWCFEPSQPQRVTTDLEAEESRKSPPTTTLGEAPKPKTRWDDLAMGIFLELLRQLGDGKGLHQLVRTTLEAKGYEFFMQQISSKKGTKGFQSAVVKGNWQTGDTESERTADGAKSTVAGDDRTTQGECTREAAGERQPPRPEVRPRHTTVKT